MVLEVGAVSYERGAPVREFHEDPAVGNTVGSSLHANDAGEENERERERERGRERKREREISVTSLYNTHTHPSHATHTPLSPRDTGVPLS